MDIRIDEHEETTLVSIETEVKVALAVHTDGEERIYLPTQASSDTTYYVENTESLNPTEKGYSIRLEEKPEKIEILD